MMDNPLRAIIVDDEASICQGLCRLIDWEAYGFCVTGLFQNGAQALEYLSCHAAELVITDIQMPVMDGLELIHALEGFFDGEIIIVSAYNEFEYARRALERGVRQYLLKPIEEEALVRALLKARAHYRERKDLQGLQEAGAYFIRQSRVHGFLFADGRLPSDLPEPLVEGVPGMVYAVGIVKALSGKPLEGSEPLETALREGMREEIAVYSAQRDGLLYLLATGVKRAAIRGLFRRIQEGLLVAGMDHVVSIGTFAERMEGIQSSRDAALWGIERAYVEGVNRLIDLSESVLEPLPDRIPDWRSEKLIEAIECGFEDLVDCEVEQFFSLLRQNFSSAGIVRTVVVGMVFQLNPTVARYGGDMGAMLGCASDVQTEVSRWHVLDDLAEWFRTLCKLILHFVRNVRQSQLLREIEQVKAAVERDYARELYLKDLAGALYISPDYLGRMFREAYGVGFTEYLNGVRVRHARELLLTTRRTVQDIALSVGYHSTDYFVKQFKKFEGKSPTAYRKAARNMREE